jgi:hypothetical protein
VVSGPTPLWRSPFIAQEEVIGNAADGGLALQRTCVPVKYPDGLFTKYCSY